LQASSPVIAGEGISSVWKSFKRDVETVRDAILGDEPAAPPRPRAEPEPPRGEPLANHDRAQVARAQGLLNQLGYPAGPVDGAYGSTTRAAIIQFQQHAGLAPTGDGGWTPLM
jgi:hypothetical protein